MKLQSVAEIVRTIQGRFKTRKVRTMSKDKVSRRQFLKWSGAGSIAIASVAPHLGLARTPPQESAESGRHALVAALGDTLIPTDPGDPGYKSLEPYKITDEVLKKLDGVTEADAIAFNNGSAAFFDGRAFLQLTESQRADYLRIVLEGGKFADKAQLKTLQKVYRQVRTRVFTLFYQNYPENVIPRDARGVPILKPGDKHQITNPNTKEVVTGWDIAGFKAQMTWEEEEERRAKFKKYWR
jgi:hypothetical protein